MAVAAWMDAAAQSALLAKVMPVLSQVAEMAVAFPWNGRVIVLASHTTIEGDAMKPFLALAGYTLSPFEFELVGSSARELHDPLTGKQWVYMTAAFAGPGAWSDPKLVTPLWR